MPITSRLLRSQINDLTLKMNKRLKMLGKYGADNQWFIWLEEREILRRRLRKLDNRNLKGSLK